MSDGVCAFVPLCHEIVNRARQVDAWMHVLFDRVRVLALRHWNWNCPQVLACAKECKQDHPAPDWEEKQRTKIQVCCLQH